MEQNRDPYKYSLLIFEKNAIKQRKVFAANDARGIGHPLAKNKQVSHLVQKLTQNGSQI